MPQFDTFSFFSQLFWVFVGFSYLYLLLCFYILPAFAAVLKIRAKKLAQTNTADGSLQISVSSPTNNSAFFDNVIIKINNISFSRTGLLNDTGFFYNYLTLKTEAFSKYNFAILTNFKTVTLFF
jgi:hypothetical protein